ncbi:MAG: hypothetical protein KDK33_05365 [Leptospiraceae bacterium]|nr:hypothetical protein [Leptospiraceae bacterium]
MRRFLPSDWDASLKRLVVDCIDRHFQHREVSSVPIEDTVGAMADLVHEHASNGRTRNSDCILADTADRTSGYVTTKLMRARRSPHILDFIL